MAMESVRQKILETLKNKEIINTKKIDSWIVKNSKKLSAKDDREIVTAETIFMSKDTYGYFSKIEIRDLLNSQYIEIIAAFRLLLLCMSEKRTFHTSSFPEVDEDGLHMYRIYEFGASKLKYYDVLAISGMSYFISGYLEGLFSVQVDFDELIKFAFKDL